MKILTGEICAFCFVIHFNYSQLHLFLLHIYILNIQCLLTCRNRFSSIPYNCKVSLYYFIYYRNYTLKKCIGNKCRCRVLNQLYIRYYSPKIPVTILFLILHFTVTLFLITISRWIKLYQKVTPKFFKCTYTLFHENN